MRKTVLLSAVSAIAVAFPLASAPAQAFDEVDWDWTHQTYSDVDAFFDIDVDFVAWGLSQVERLQVMAGDMTAFANGSYASYNGVDGHYESSVVGPIIITQTADADVNQGQIGLQGNLAAQLGGAVGGSGLMGSGGGGYNDQDQAGVQSNIAAQIGAAIAGNVVIINMDDMGGNWVDAVDARKHLAKVEVGASAISNVATMDGEHVSMAHDGQIAFGKFNAVDGVFTYPGDHADDEEQAILANLALSNWIGADSYGQFGSSGNTNRDMLMLAWTAAQYGLISKGTNSAFAFGDHVTDAQLDVSATAAANMHAVEVSTRLEPTEDGYNHHHGWGDVTVGTDNVALVDLNQFGYQDTYAHASAVGHSITGYSYLGKLEAPALKVTASALGNVSSVTNKFSGASYGANP